MRKVHISTAKPGDRIAKTIFTESGNILLGTGIELSERFIERLKNMGIDTIYVEDKHTEDIIPEDIIRDETRKKAVESVYKTMTTLMDTPSVKGRTSLPDLGKTFRSVFGEILSDISSRREVLVNLSNLHTLDGYLFHHSVNVAVLAGIIGVSKGYNRDQLIDLGIGALLFDIGMTNLPKELWNKKGTLSDEERKRMNNHTEDGYHILRYQHDISLLSAHCALQHHERFAGTGYPRELRSEQIHEYAQIVAIADVYDALISPRSYRQGYNPNEATEFLMAAGNTHFNLELVKIFLRHISIYPISTTVQLNTGHVGVVSHVDPIAVHRPIVRILQEPDGSPTASPYELDLKKELHLIITKTL